MLSNLFKSGVWRSSFRSMEISFNKNVWWLIPDLYDREDGSLFGVLDRNDGSSFGIDLSCVSDDEIYEYEWCESEYFSRLYNLCSTTDEIDRFNLTIGSVVFRCVSYSYVNRRYGDQVVVRGMAIGKAAVAGISMAWPAGLAFENSNIPPKHRLFVDDFEFDVDLNA